MALCLSFFCAETYIKWAIIRMHLLIESPYDELKDCGVEQPEYIW